MTKKETECREVEQLRLRYNFSVSASVIDNKYGILRVTRTPGDRQFLKIRFNLVYTYRGQIFN